MIPFLTKVDRILHIFNGGVVETLRKANKRLKERNIEQAHQITMLRIEVADLQKRYSALFRDFHETINNCTTLANALQDTKEELNQLKALIPKPPTPPLHTPLPTPLTMDPWFHLENPPTWRPNKPYPPIIAEAKKDNEDKA